MSTALEHARDLGDYLAASPSSYHAAAEGAIRLTAAGFAVQDETEEWDRSPGGHFLVRDGALLAWSIPDDAGPTTGFRIVGSHTDSTTFKLKPHPDVGAYGWQQLGVEVYGSPLLNSWLNRDLGLAGRLVLRGGETVLVRSEAILSIPQLAIHLDRGVNEEGLQLGKQQHTTPIWSVGHPELSILDQLAEPVGASGSDVAGYDVVAFDTARAAVFGPRQEFLAGARLDNLSSVHASVTALLAHPVGDHIQVVAAFDHEEIGSESRSGAAGPVLADVLARISLSLGASGDQQHQALARSYCLSADAGHAVHPNYANRHDPANLPLLNGGPLLKINANQRYATDGKGAALWRRACARAGVPTQEFVSNNNLPCGSTIGPLAATRLGVATVDVGVPLLSMHSARELAGVADPHALSLAIAAFLTAD